MTVNDKTGKGEQLFSVRITRREFLYLPARTKIRILEEQVDAISSNKEALASLTDIPPD